MAARAAGIGMGKTGTTSLCEAVRMLGLTAIQGQATAAYQHDLFRCLSTGSPRFRALEDYDFAIDFPNSHFVEIAWAYPQMKFFLTLRADERAWVESVLKHHERRFIELWPGMPVHGMHIYRLINDRWINQRDARVWLYRYHEHNDAVRRFFADQPGRLMEIDITSEPPEQLWTKISSFLDVPLPPGLPLSVFPHKNKAPA